MRAESWLVGFLPSPNRGVYKILAGAGEPTSHCYALRFDAKAGVWLLAEHSVMGLDLRTLPEESAQRLISTTLEHGHLLHCPGARRRPSRWPPLLLTCTAAVKALLGVRDWRIVTPAQLRSALLKRGAQAL